MSLQEPDGRAKCLIMCGRKSGTSRALYLVMLNRKTHNLTATVEVNLAQRLYSVSERRIIESYLSAWLDAKSQEDKLAELLTIPTIIPGCPL